MMDRHLFSSLPYFGFVQQPGHLTLTQATVVQVHYPKPYGAVSTVAVHWIVAPMTGVQFPHGTPMDLKLI